MARSKSINQEWEDFKQKIIPPNASKIQIQEMRRAFYAGAVSVFDLMTSLGDKDLTEEQSIEEISKIEMDLKTFLGKVGEEF